MVCCLVLSDSPQLYVQALNGLSPVCRQFSFDQAFHGRSNPVQGVDDSGMNSCGGVGLVCLSCLYFVATQ